MYSFVKGSSRLFVKGSRDADDGDNLPDPGDRQVTERADSLSTQFEAKTQMASASQESREMFRSAHVRSGLKTVHTQRVVRKTTTVSLGERKETTTLKVCSILSRKTNPQTLFFVDAIGNSTCESISLHLLPREDATTTFLLTSFALSRLTTVDRPITLNSFYNKTFFSFFRFLTLSNMMRVRHTERHCCAGRNALQKAILVLR